MDSRLESNGSKGSRTLVKHIYSHLYLGDEGIGVAESIEDRYHGEVAIARFVD